MRPAVSTSRLASRLDVWSSLRTTDSAAPWPCWSRSALMSRVFHPARRASARRTDVSAPRRCASDKAAGSTSGISTVTIKSLVTVSFVMLSTIHTRYDSLSWHTHELDSAMASIVSVEFRSLSPLDAQRDHRTRRKCPMHLARVRWPVPRGERHCHGLRAQRRCEYPPFGRPPGGRRLGHSRGDNRPPHRRGDIPLRPRPATPQRRFRLGAAPPPDAPPCATSGQLPGQPRGRGALRHPQPKARLPAPLRDPRPPPPKDHRPDQPPQHPKNPPHTPLPDPHKTGPPPTTTKPNRTNQEHNKGDQKSAIAKKRPLRIADNAGQTGANSKQPSNEQQ